MGPARPPPPASGSTSAPTLVPKAGVHLMPGPPHAGVHLMPGPPHAGSTSCRGPPHAGSTSCRVHLMPGPLMGAPHAGLLGMRAEVWPSTTGRGGGREGGKGLPSCPCWDDDTMWHAVLGAMPRCDVERCAAWPHLAMAHPTAAPVCWLAMAHPTAATMLARQVRGGGACASSGPPLF